MNPRWFLRLEGLAVSAAAPVPASVALVWAAHIGADRALGYGLKHPTAFGDTYLGETTASEASATVALDASSDRRDRHGDGVGSTLTRTGPTDRERPSAGATACWIPSAGATACKIPSAIARSESEKRLA